MLTKDTEQHKVFLLIKLTNVKGAKPAGNSHTGINTTSIMKLKLHEHGHYWFTLVARNGQVSMTSQVYPKKQSATRQMKKLGNIMIGVKCYDEHGKQFW